MLNSARSAPSALSIRTPLNDDPFCRSSHCWSSSIASCNSLGCSVLRAASRDEALAVLDSGAHVDLVFSDVVMPAGNGLELAHDVRN